MANERCLIAGYCTSQNLGRDGSRSRSVAAEAVGAPCRLLLVSSAISPILFIDPQALSLTLFPYQTTRTSVLARGPGVPHPLSIARSPLITVYYYYHSHPSFRAAPFSLRFVVCFALHSHVLYHSFRPTNVHSFFQLSIHIPPILWDLILLTFFGYRSYPIVLCTL